VLGPNDLVLCSGTLIAASLREKVDAAAQAGYSGISLWLDDIERAREEGSSDADIRALIADHGLQIAELDPLLSWLGSGTLGTGAADDSEAMLGRSEDEFHALADAIGGTVLNCAHPFEGRVDVDRAAEAFAGVCDRAAEHGLAAAIEFLPWTGIPDAASAARIAQAAGRENGGIMLDTWHHLRSGSDDEALRRIPGDLIKGVQINSAPRKPNGNPMIESMHERMLPDAGDIDVAQIVRILDAAGSRAPIGVEVFSDELNRLPPREAAQRCADAARNVLSKARPS